MVVRKFRILAACLFGAIADAISPNDFRLPDLHDPLTVELTLEDAIEHAWANADGTCSREHARLAEWLEELLAYRACQADEGEAEEAEEAGETPVQRPLTAAAKAMIWKPPPSPSPVVAPELSGSARSRVQAAKEPR